MQTIAPRQRAFVEGWWPVWPRLVRSPARVRAPARGDGAPPATSPLPEQDPTLPLYHDAQLW